MIEKRIIRVKALAWIEDRGYLFVVRMHDSVKGDDYYRSIGGSVEFGETTRDALLREVQEELHTSIQINDNPLVLENIFICDGVQGHEIDYIYPSTFTDPRFLYRKSYTLIEDTSEVLEALWVNREQFLNGNLRLVPESLLDIFRRGR
jgi:8-oxo-dGTP pyrophosphatase MutT (NUDIX family)